MGKLQGANQKQEVLDDWLRMNICFSLVGPKLEIGTKQGSCDLYIKSWQFGGDCYRRYCLSSCTVTRDSSLTSYKPDFQQGSLLQVVVGFPGQLAAGCGSEFCVYVWSGHSPFVYSVSHSQEVSSLPEFQSSSSDQHTQSSFSLLLLSACLTGLSPEAQQGRLLPLFFLKHPSSLVYLSKHSPLRSKSL